MSIRDENTTGKGAQASQLKRSLKPIFFILFIFMILILSVGSLFFLQMSKGKGSQSSIKSGTSTPIETPTAIYLETPPAQALFYDTFKNNALGWSISNTTGFSRAVNSDTLSLTNTNPGTTLIESLPTNTTFDNFKVSVELTMLKSMGNNATGIYIRGDSNLIHDYRIDLDRDGTFAIAKEYVDSKNIPQSIFLDGPRKSSVVNPPGIQNTITVIVNGSQLQLLLNNVEVSTVTDNDYLTGQVAIFARLGRDSPDVTVLISKVEVDKLQK
jgi:Domain of Unknown Function (DUF1080)